MASEAPGATAPDTAAPTPTPKPAPEGHGAQSFWALAIGSIGVVFGDIGTSPLYAMREALHHTRSGVTTELAVLGVVSLVIWALLLVVTVKYVVFLMRADNKGEGGTLALMALAQHPGQGRQAVRRRSSSSASRRGAVLRRRGHHPGHLGSVGDRGSQGRPGPRRALDNYVLPIAGRHPDRPVHGPVARHGQRGAFFGPITLLWFLMLGGLGLWHMFDDPSILRAALPHYGVLFLFQNGFLGFVILGSVFLAVTGAEALYADMGHFGKGADPAAWLWLRLALPGPQLPRPGRDDPVPPGSRPIRSGPWSLSSPTGRCWPWRPRPPSSPARP
jgi:KUP system potassium uptake protein